MADGVDGNGKFDTFSISGADHWYTLPRHRVRAINNPLAQETFLPGWLRAVGELEALGSLAAFGYENPDYVLPEIVEGPRSDQVVVTAIPYQTSVEQIEDVVIRFAGDSGDGMQLAGTQFTASSAIDTCSASRSASLNTATVPMPMRRAVRITRQAISPRLAMSIFSNMAPPTSGTRRSASFRWAG